MGLASFLMVRTVEIVVVILLITFMPSLPPNTSFTQFKVVPPMPLEGKLALNARLNGVEHIYENELKGPEAFADFNGELYSSLHGGDVVKLIGDHIVPVVKFGKPCKGFHEESICGRPLGLNFDKDGTLFVADAYMGLWKVDVKTGKKTQLVSIDKEIEGKKPMVPNSLAIAKNGDIFWTDSSSEFKLEDGVFSMLSDGSGRLIHYNAVTKTNTVLISDLHFANGVMLSPDEDFVIVSETAQSRIHRYYLKGSKKGTNDIFIDGLPGLPDNLKSDGKDGYLVPLVFARDADHPTVFQIFGPFPLARKFVARLLGLAELGFRTIERVYPNFYTQRAIHWVGHFEALSVFTPARVTILHLNKDGQIIDSIHTEDKLVTGISEVHVFNGALYLGSPYNNYVGKLPLSKAGWEHMEKSKAEAQKRTAKVISTQAPKKVKPEPTPVMHAPSPTATPDKKTPPSTAAPVKKTPSPTAASVKKTPPPTAAPVKKTPPPTDASVKIPPPVVAPIKQAPSTAAPVKQRSPQIQAPVKHALPTKPVKEELVKKTRAAPVTKTTAKQAPPTMKQNTIPVKQAPSLATPVRQAAPNVAPKKQVPPMVVPVKQAPPPAKQDPPVPVPVTQVPPKVISLKQTPPPATQTPPPVKQITPAKQPVAKEPVVPVKEKAQPKSESIPPRK